MLTKSLRTSFKLQNIRHFRAAVLLAGSGVYDGSEITETTSLFIALSKQKINYQCYAPNRDQMHVVNHLDGSEMNETRNVLVESARIARGDVKEIGQLSASNYDALFVPGGFGVAKNFSDFGVKGADMTVHEDIEQVLKDFHKNKKYIGMCCISPIVAAKVFGKQSGGPGAKLTLGSRGSNWPFNGSIDAATSFGNELVEADLYDETCHDAVNRIVTAPAYMKGDAQYDEIYHNVKMMVDDLATYVRNDPSVGCPIAMRVDLQIKDEFVDQFIKVVKQEAKGTRQEPGNFRFDLLRDPENPSKFTVFEIYKNQAALDAHRETPHFKLWLDFKSEGGVEDVKVAMFDAKDFGY